jgi:lysophospholipase L1-like esterase
VFPLKRFIRSLLIIVVVTFAMLFACEMFARAYMWTAPVEEVEQPDGPRVVYGFSTTGYGDLQPNQSTIVSLYYIRPYYLLTNSVGLRNAEEINPDENVIRILAIGDSFTFGAYVHNQETWTSRLEGELNTQLFPDAQVQVLNAGIPGYTIEDELAYLREKGLALNPDVVILGFYTNDIFDLYPPIRQNLSRAAVLNAEAQAEAPNPLRQFLHDNLALYNVLGGWFASQQVNSAVQEVQQQTENFQEIYLNMTFLNPTQTDYQTYWDSYESQFNELVTLLNENNIPLVLMAFPDVSQVVMGDVFTDVPQQFLARVTEETNVPYLDLLPVLREAGDIEETYLMYYDARRTVDPNSLELTGHGYTGDGHPSPYGYLVAARTLADFLVQNGVVP